MPVTHWKIGATSFEINPISVKISRRKRFHILEIISGSPVVQEGREEVGTITCDITVLSETAYNQFNTWFNTGGQLSLTDDHNDVYVVVIEQMDLNREYATSHDYYYAGSVMFRILSGL